MENSTLYLKTTIRYFGLEIFLNRVFQQFAYLHVNVQGYT